MIFVKTYTNGVVIQEITGRTFPTSSSRPCGRMPAVVPNRSRIPWRMRTTCRTIRTHCAQVSTTATKTGTVVADLVADGGRCAKTRKNICQAIFLTQAKTSSCSRRERWNAYRPRLGPQRSPARGRDGGQMQSRGVKGVIAPDPVPAESDDPDGDDFLGVRASRACLFPFFFFFDSLSSTLVALSFYFLIYLFHVAFVGWRWCV